ncbi:hypothetical protein [Dellaglioa algida]|uniref:hypothetical protein n=1 Tax=Dellaglioa algida TaxID=105612 RepID=UPI000716F045|nr:hypothetical protein [Dellaglioa algida]MDK1734774.1 hypothetical protein [Dellaglioa algida]
MDYYQARISIETARLLEKMRLFYEEKVGGTVTKGDCLIKAYYDSLWVKNWKEIFDSPMPPINNFDYKVSSTGQMLKIQITNDVKESIQNLKSTLPEIIGTRSVTVGVCIREILKSAYITNFEHKNESLQVSKVKNTINEQRKIANSFSDITIQTEVFKMLDDIELEFIKILKK